MSLKAYLDQPDRPVSELRFHYAGGVYKGRGVMTWSPEKGYHIEAPLEQPDRPPNVIGLGGSGIIRSNDLGTIRMRVGRQKRTWAIAPNVYLAGRFEVFFQDRLSVNVARVLFSDRYHQRIESQKYWTGSSLYRLGTEPIFPDQVKTETHIGGERTLEQHRADGVLFESENGQKVIGRRVHEDYFEVRYWLPKSLWSKTEAWRWAEAVNDSLSICLAENVQMLQRETTRGDKLYREVIAGAEARSLQPFPLLGHNPILDKGIFIALTQFFARNERGADVCRRIFRQLSTAATQRNFQAREFFVASTLEAAFRTLWGTPFQTKKGKDSFKIEAAMKNFCSTYLTADWEKACSKVMQAYFRLRNRNAHPDWLFEERGALSEKSRASAFEDMQLLSLFFGAMILALAGIKDIDPDFLGGSQ